MATPKRLTSNTVALPSRERVAAGRVRGAFARGRNPVGRGATPATTLLALAAEHRQPAQGQ
jgi:hypothetical protein